MTAVFQISLTYVQVRIIYVSNDYVYSMSKNINANDTEFPRSVTFYSNFINSKKVSKLKYIFLSRVWVEHNIYFNICSISLQTRSLGPCDRAQFYTKNMGSKST